MLLYARCDFNEKQNNNSSRLFFFYYSKAAAAINLLFTFSYFCHQKQF
jgi:hypothetical protein